MAWGPADEKLRSDLWSEDLRGEAINAGMDHVPCPRQSSCGMVLDSRAARSDGQQALLLVWTEAHCQTLSHSKAMEIVLSFPSERIDHVQKLPCTAGMYVAGNVMHW